MEPEYEGRIRFRVLPASTPEGQIDVKRFGLEAKRHGLVTLAPDGEVVATLPGHEFGPAEIRAHADALLR